MTGKPFWRELEESATASKRDDVAMHLMAAMIIRGGVAQGDTIDDGLKITAEVAVRAADALISELLK